MIYLDNAATTFPKPEAVYDEMDKVNRTLAVNAGRGSYKAAKSAAHIVDETRGRLTTLFHSNGIANVVFTPSVTHAINQVLQGLMLAEGQVVYISPYEHNAVARPLYNLQKKKGFHIELLPVKDNLTIDIDRIAYLFTVKPPTVVIVNSLSNVTGYKLPFVDIFLLAKKYKAVTILDVAQTAGLIELDMRKINTDILCFAGHKTLYGPFGVAGFVIKNDVTLDISFAGGTGSDSLNLHMPDKIPGRYEAASQNILAISGLNAALKELKPEEHLSHVRMITDYLLDALEDMPDVRILGMPERNQILGIVSFVVEGYDSNDVGRILDEEYDIAVRTGYHCAPYVHKLLRDEAYAGTIRIGVGMFTQKSDIDALVEALESL